MAHLTTQLNDLTSATTNDSMTVESASKCLGEVLEKLECLKRKVEGFSSEPFIQKYEIFLELMKFVCSG